MSLSFLQHTAQYLHRHFHDDWEDLCIVLPNRRAGLFLRKHLAEGIDRPHWSPAIFAIEDFMGLLSGLRESESLSLLVDLYSIHRELEKEKAQTFEEFLKWAPQLLADFNDIDRYMIDADELFSYLSEARAMNLWNPEQTPLTEFQKNYLKFYQSLAGYHRLLTQKLLEKGEGYQGQVFRLACERMEKNETALSWKKVVFAGFNALTVAEERVMECLKGQGKADFLRDADHYYTDNPNQEAGFWLRERIAKQGKDEISWIFDDFRTSDHDIEIIGIPDVAGQVKYCGELLSKMTVKPDEKTAIVLPDEKLLIPLLNALPENVETLNITMGLSLKQTSLADLFELLFRARLHTAQMKADPSQIHVLYFRDVLKIFQHPLFVRIAEKRMVDTVPPAELFLRKWQNGRSIFVTLDDLVDEDLFSIGSGFMDPFFRSWVQPEDVVHDLREIIGMVRESEPEDAFAFARMVNQLDQVIATAPGVFTWVTVYQLFRQLIESTSLPFSGEPLTGLQIMGMLETRVLDFDNIILLSCNEGIVPAGKTVHSFIPNDIRKEFGLPGYMQRDAVFAYHFYRLLQRARKVWLLYNTEPDVLGGGEKSRFIHQLLHELPLWNPSARITDKIMITPVLRQPLPEMITISKTGEVRELLLRKAVDGFSPTALNAYRKCSLRFYFSEIAGLKEPEDLTDTVDPKTLGNMVHEALNELYRPYLEKPLTREILHSLNENTGAAVEEAFRKKFSGSAIHYGKNHLMLRVAGFMIRNFLKKESDLVKASAEKGATISVVMLEQILRRTINIPFEDRELTVTIKGFVDRIDRVGDHLQVIDYKTGFTDPKEIHVKEWEDLYHDPLLDKAFQLLSYSWLLPGAERISSLRAGIMSLQKPGNGILNVSVPQEDTSLTHEALNHFEDVISQIIRELYTLDIPFVQTSDPEGCRFCDYSSICRR